METKETYGKINLILEDCMNILCKLPDNAFDLAIVDPPYGINSPNMQMGTNRHRSKGGYPGESVAVKLKKGRLNSGGGKLKGRALQTMHITWDYEVPSKEYFTELFRVSRNQIIWGGNYFDLPPSRGIICWDKKQPWTNFSQFELAWTSFDKPARMVRISTTGGANREKKIHPTQKPVSLYEWLLTNYAQAGWQILDTHGGSMSIALAAYNLGFDLTVIERDETYFRNARQRLLYHQSQQRMAL